ncbi:hypothetical protein MHU86_4337 [Fragilaria crotonensis]|nr:hypothetical protein MHU86_4337 [Fragilaria crotonensis]
MPFQDYDQDDPEAAVVDIPDDNDEEHNFITMTRPVFLTQSRSLFGDDDEVDTDGFSVLAAATPTSRPNRGSVASIAFTHDEVYDESDDEDGDDDLFDFKKVKAAQENLLHENVSNSVFYGFMILTAGLVVYMIFLMFEVEAEEPDPVINYIVNQTRHVDHHRFPFNKSNPTTGLPALPSAAANTTPTSSTWEHVFDQVTQPNSRDSVDGVDSSPPGNEGTSGASGNKKSNPQGDIQVDAKGSQLIGFIEAPPKIEELVLLMEKVGGTGAQSISLDSSEQREIVNEGGDTFHCGIKVDGNAVTLECLFEAELCRVYLGDRDCESAGQV